MGTYVIKAEIRGPLPMVFRFDDQKTMYGGKHIAAGDTLYLLASENEGGRGLVASAVVLTATPTPRRPGGQRQTPRVSITAQRTALAARPLGRQQLRPPPGKPAAPAKHGPPATPAAELHFKLYRQATNKVVAISDAAAAFIASHCQAGEPAAASDGRVAQP